MLYTSDKKKRFLAPAYDVVNTLVYLPKDKPALSLQGKKIWWNQKGLIDFGTNYCLLNQQEAFRAFDECIEATKGIIKEIEGYLKVNESFKVFGERCLKVLHFSLDENISTSYKELPHGVL